MRSRRPAVDHTEAVARRLALLNAELDAARAPRGALPEGEAGALVLASGPTRISGTPPLQWDDDPSEAAGPGEDAGPEARGGAGPLLTEPTPAVPIGPAVVAGQRRSRSGPGRHAARPQARGPARWLPGEGTGPDGVERDDAERAWSPGQAVVLLAGLALALALSCGWLLLGRSGDGVPVTPVAEDVPEGRAPAGDAGAASAGSAPGGSRGVPGASAAPGAEPNAGPVAGPGVGGADGAAGASGAGRAGGASTGEVVVDVAGKVRRPGLVVLPAGSRVADALDRAGGVRRGADTSGINLARVLVDGEQVLVGVDPPPGTAAGAVGSVAPPGAGASGGQAPGALVNVNTADASQLETLPGVGPVMAGAIIEWRTTHGGFTSLDDLLEVRGIGEATLARLAPLVTL